LFFSTLPPPPDSYTLSLHDALPILSADFLGLEVIDAGRDRVAVGGARGTPPPDSLKVAVVYRDGWRAVGLALLSGPDVDAKAERSEEHTSELQSRSDLVCRLLLEKK